MKGTLYLVNRAHPLPEEPAAEDLASVRSVKPRYVSTSEPK